MEADLLVDDLLDHYIYEKDRLLQEAGARGGVDKERLRTLMRPRIEKMAHVVKDWSVTPDILMTAVFAWAKHNRHPDGPMPNMLFSVKYLSKALAHYLQVPYEVVMERRSVSLFLERMDFEFERFRDELEKAGVTDLTTATSYPPEARYLMSLQRGDAESMFYIAPDLLEHMKNDRRVTTWLEHRGVTYEAVAKQFNNMRKKYEQSR